MSASKRLRELYDQSLNDERTLGRVDAEGALYRATPEIVAVVEQMERVLAPWEKLRGQGGPLAVAADEALTPAWDALAALEEKLEPITQNLSDELGGL